MKISILHIDDNEAFVTLFKTFLEAFNADFTIDIVTSPIKALELLKKHNTYDIIISDYEMPELSGLDLFHELKRMQNTDPFILFTGTGREGLILQALNSGIDYYVQKMPDFHSMTVEINNIILKAIKQKELEVEASRWAESIQVIEKFNKVVKDISPPFEILLTNMIHTLSHFLNLKATFDGSEYITTPFIETSDSFSLPIIINGQQRGLLELFYQFSNKKQFNVFKRDSYTFMQAI